MAISVTRCTASLHSSNISSHSSSIHLHQEIFLEQIYLICDMRLQLKITYWTISWKSFIHKILFTLESCRPSPTTWKLIRRHGGLFCTWNFPSCRGGENLTNPNKQLAAREEVNISVRCDWIHLTEYRYHFNSGLKSKKPFFGYCVDKRECK